jgi:alanyl-tRNA synthetase
LFQEQTDRLDRLSRRLHTPVVDLEARLDSFMVETEEMKSRLVGLERTALRSEAEVLVQRAVDVDGAQVVVGRTSATNADGMREMGDFIKDKMANVVVVLGAVAEGNPILVAMVTPDLVDRGLNAGTIARDTAKVMGGGGGGKADLAQAGGKYPEKLDQALSGVPGLVREALA